MLDLSHMIQDMTDTKEQTHTQWTIRGIRHQKSLNFTGRLKTVRAQRGLRNSS